MREGRGMNYDWNWLVFLQATIDGGSRYAWWMLSGFGSKSVAPMWMASSS